MAMCLLEDVSPSAQPFQTASKLWIWIKNFEQSKTLVESWLALCDVMGGKTVRAQSRHAMR